jgi:hypothetical protein
LARRLECDRPFHIQPGIRVNFDKKNGWYNSTVSDGAGNPVVYSASPTATLLGASWAFFAPAVRPAVQRVELQL